MKWFGMKAAAGEAGQEGRGRPVLARAWGSGAVALGEWPASYEAQLRAGVIGNPVAQRAMRLVSEGAGACALKVGGVDGEAAARIRALVARASAGQSLIETLASHVLLHGNGYVQVIAGADGMPAELFALRPERVSVEADARGWPAAYLY
ncbi:MAG: phage portal protein, partial [Sphingobium sp.]